MRILRFSVETPASSCEPQYEQFEPIEYSGIVSNMSYKIACKEGGLGEGAEEMKKVTKSIVREEIEHLDYMQCDSCGRKSTFDDWRGLQFTPEDLKKLSSFGFDFNEHYWICKTTVEFRQGDYYPDSGSGTEMEIDLCPICFIGKVVPFLKSIGCKCDFVEFDW